MNSCSKHRSNTNATKKKLKHIINAIIFFIIKKMKQIDLTVNKHFSYSPKQCFYRPKILLIMKNETHLCK